MRETSEVGPLLVTGHSVSYWECLCNRISVSMSASQIASRLQFRTRRFQISCCQYRPSILIGASAMRSPSHLAPSMNLFYFFSSRLASNSVPHSRKPIRVPRSSSFWTIVTRNVFFWDIPMPKVRHRRPVIISCTMYQPTTCLPGTAWCVFLSASIVSIVAMLPSKIYSLTMGLQMCNTSHHTHSHPQCRPRECVFFK